MPVIVMKTVSVSSHPNADSLKVYSFEAPGQATKQIVANLENEYEVGDLVYVALEGSVLKDGTKIKPTKLRGVSSYGMALGKADVELGTDCSDQFCDVSVEINNSGFSMIKWPSIESLHNIYRNIKKIDVNPKLNYIGKVKLDGTNAAVQVATDGSIAVQSRSNIITPDKDNLGFAKWAYENKDYFSSLAGAQHLTIFGEWAGVGIQKRTAISGIGRKIFAVFAIQKGIIDAVFEIDPVKIESQLPKHQDIYVLPYYGAKIEFDFSNKLELQKSADVVNQMVIDVEKEDPWVQSIFGIKGIGEGLVMYPQPEEGVQISRHEFTEFVFKAKGELHKVVNTKQPVQLNAEVAKNIDEFVALFATNTRLEQGVAVACEGKYDIKYIGNFLKWFSSDVKKESVAELEASGLEFKQVNKMISAFARNWYLEKVNKIC